MKRCLFPFPFFISQRHLFCLFKKGCQSRRVILSHGKRSLRLSVSVICSPGFSVPLGNRTDFFKKLSTVLFQFLCAHSVYIQHFIFRKRNPEAHIPQSFIRRDHIRRHRPGPGKFCPELPEFFKQFRAFFRQLCCLSRLLPGLLLLFLRLFICNVKRFHLFSKFL